jgi:hypothetical protein
MHMTCGSMQLQEGSELTGLFSSFGTHATLLQLLPENYASHGLLGAVIENMRNSGFFGAAVWDGRRIHTLEGFGSANEAKASARDVLAMISAIHSGEGQDLLSHLPVHGDPLSLAEQHPANGQQQHNNFMPRWPHAALKPVAGDHSSPLTMHMQAHDRFPSCAAVRSSLNFT